MSSSPCSSSALISERIALYLVSNSVCSLMNLELMMPLLSAMAKPARRMNSLMMSMKRRRSALVMSARGCAMKILHSSTGPEFTMGTTLPWITCCSEFWRGGLNDSSLRSCSTRPCIISMAFSHAVSMCSRYATTLTRVVTNGSACCTVKMILRFFCSPKLSSWIAFLPSSAYAASNTKSRTWPNDAASPPTGFTAPICMYAFVSRSASFDASTALFDVSSSTSPTLLANCSRSLSWKWPSVITGGMR
mmetsp:Transcript_6080/g.14746  ORF Transcript_6080/g.14746 Transcript_6080/m.14746 type:complete len:248 (+) Transcript_6080:120-863(+)